MTQDPMAPHAWTVLVVDDEPEVRKFLQNALEQGIPGLHALLAENGTTALDRLAHEPVDLVISDQRMPGMQGTEFLKLAARMAPEVPRVLLTGYADVDTALRAVNAAHVSAFFQKPAPLEGLLTVILRLLEVRHDTLQHERAFRRTAALVATS